MNDESSIDGGCPVPFSMFSTGAFAGSLMTDGSASAAWNAGVCAAAQTPAFQAALADPSVIKDPANAPVLNMLNGTGQPPSIDDSSFISHLDPRLAAPFLEGFAQSIGLVLLVAAVVIVMVPSAVSAGVVVPARARVVRSASASARSCRPSRCASLMFGTISPRGVCAAIPRLT